MKEDFIIDFIREIADEDMEMVRGIFFVRGIGLVCPVDADLLQDCGQYLLQTDKEVRTYRLVDTSAVQSLHGAFCCSWVVVFDKAVVETF